MILQYSEETEMHKLKCLEKENVIISLNLRIDQYKIEIDKLKLELTKQGVKPPINDSSDSVK